MAIFVSVVFFCICVGIRNTAHDLFIVIKYSSGSFVFVNIKNQENSNEIYPIIDSNINDFFL